MSVSVSRLEAGRPSCDSMWFAGVSRSWLLTAREAGLEGDQGHGNQGVHNGLSFNTFRQSKNYKRACF